ncbi:Succinate dehydrogenase assembly factor 3, mitochondrial [Gracilariopsis chorda]|uniref:Succinate dehydrogenase assembly factor 3 n=1 Tax=Gracilariopsis chorda TaxID=448386 RepID=A0A2V3IJF7_9FLOR|nr:Succinate dehydrogenase assembly factor 3, mitochondrial [Gracilariopsis chorda]|eukprot:PXF42189.1 Succinate dehydrogenase assembly factor 3, mitochondrial [Gracilariopsis chorda]
MSARHRLSLYRRILRLHRLKLPDLQRSVGDQYVRQEFRAHRDVKPEQEKQFLHQWEDYAAHLSLEADFFGLGRDLSKADVESLSDDQKAQLQRLQSSAASIGIQEKAEAGDNPYEKQ